MDSFFPFLFFFGGGGGGGDAGFVRCPSGLKPLGVEVRAGFEALEQFALRVHVDGGLGL